MVGEPQWEENANAPCSGDGGGGGANATEVTPLRKGTQV